MTCSSNGTLINKPTCVIKGQRVIKPKNNGEKGCPGNCAPGNKGQNVCESTTGECLFGCKDSFYGANCTQSCTDVIRNCKHCSISDTTSDVVCNECIGNFYRENEKKCIACNYWCNRDLNSQIAVCRENDGYCNHGCAPGRYGFKCGIRCTSTCKNVCNRETGYCEMGCKYVSYCGPTCDLQCQDGCSSQHCNQTCDCVRGCTPTHWGGQCRKVCGVNCLKPPDSSVKVCNIVDGTCLFGCDGKKFWGNHCNKPCSNNCVNGTCEQDSGNCTDGCATDTFYDEPCDTPCNDNCIGGTCERGDGYCKNGCKIGKYGAKCNMDCSKNCFNNTCTRVNGHCSVSCKNGFYGDACNDACSDKCLNTICERKSGNCTYGCIPGYVDHRCLSDGYELTDNGTSVCNTSGRWSSIPKCKIKDCHNLLNPKNGHVDQSNGTTYLSVSTYICDTGYTLKGKNTAICTKEGIWDNLNVECVINDCGPLEDLNITNHELLLIFSNTKVGARATITCRDGYYNNRKTHQPEGVSSDLISCSVNGTWSNLPNCTRKDCGNLYNIHIDHAANRRVHNDTKYKSTADIDCDEGYYIKGQQQPTGISTYTIKCSNTGHWHYTPICILKDCGKLDNISMSNADNRSEINGTIYTSIAHVSCNVGYKDEGKNQTAGIESKMIRCNKNGLWGDLPKCVRKGCPENCAPRNRGENICDSTTWECLFGCKDGFYGANCTNSCTNAISNCKHCSISDTNSGVVCNECIRNYYRTNENRCISCNYWCGYDAGSPIAVCRENDGYCNHGCTAGRYGLNCGLRCSSTCKNACHRDTGHCEMGCKYVSYCGPTCEIQCQDGCSSQHCNQTCDCVKGCTPTHWGEQCRKVCNVNCVKPSDRSVRVCNDNDGTCIYGCDGKKFWGNECNKQCSNNCVNGTCEQDSGNCTAGCTTDTFYDLSCDKPCNENCIGGTCERVDGYCKNGCKVGKYGTKCNMDCSKNCFNDVCTRVKGQCTISCKNGFYGDSCNDTCSDKCINLKCERKDGNCTYGCVSGYSGLHCLTGCGSLNNPENGYVTFESTKYNSFAKVTCKDGYYLIDNGTSVCTDSGRWSGIPKCNIIDCLRLIDPQNGHVDKSNGTTYQSVSTYSCYTGYTLKGKKDTTCTKDGIWDNINVTCEINDCGEPKIPDHGSVDKRSGTTYMSQIKYSCDTGYALIGNVSAICQANKTWSSINQLCKSKEILRKLPPMCFSCDGMSSPEYCDRVEHCQQNQICYTESYKTDYGKVFRSGCMDLQKCHKEENNTLSSVCVQCCTTDMCNNKGCGNTDFPSRENRGPMCFDCQHIGDANTCRKVTMCSSDQLCSIEKQQWGDSFHYKLGCTHHLCNNLSHEMFGPKPSCHACCKEDFCNRNCTSSNSVPGDIFVG